MIDNLGFIKLEGFLRRDQGNINKLKICFISCGQYGGRQGDEFARIGYKVIALNTSDSDLSDLKIVKDIIKLDGYNGAVKDIVRGQTAIKDNREKIIEMLQRDDIVSADFVFVVAGMGGGTGNAAAPIILNNLSRVRKPFNGKPSFGAIVSVPGSWEARGIKKNARWGLSHLHEMVQKNACGSITIVDNEKLITMTQSIFSDTDTKLDWTDYGNAMLTSLVTEIAFLTTLPAGKTFDEDELLDVWSTPGYLSLGKCTFDEATELNDKNLPSLIKRSFDLSPTASDYDFELDAVNGFMAVIRPLSRSNPIVNEMQFRSFEERFGQFIANAEKPHTGLIENSEWGQITSKGKDVSNRSPRAILYTGAVCTELPLRISRMLEEIRIEEEELERKKSERPNRVTLDLSDYKEVQKPAQKVVAAAPVNDDFDLFSTDTDKSTKKETDWDKFDI